MMRISDGVRSVEFLGADGDFTISDRINSLTIEEGGIFYTDLPPLQKRRTSGGMMSFSWCIRRAKDSLILMGLIIEVGKKDRVFESVVTSGSMPLIERAINQLVAKMVHKRDKDGWRVAGSEDTRLIKEPMLLHRWDKAKKKEFDWLVSPKLDGIRGTFDVPTHKVYSRKRSSFNLPTLEDQLITLGIGADGELWHPGHDWETISGTVSRDRDISGVDSKGNPIKLFKADLQFHIFDRTDMPGVPYVERLASLIDLKISEGFPNLFVVPSVYCESPEAVEKVYDGIMLLEHEGAVARRLDSLFEWDTRSWDVLKLKPLFSKEFKFHSITYDTDPLYGRLISYNMYTADGLDTFKATPAKSKAERAEDYKKISTSFWPETVWITCEYRDTYTSGKPKFAVMKGIRQDINL